MTTNHPNRIKRFNAEADAFGEGFLLGLISGALLAGALAGLIIWLMWRFA